MRKLMLVQAKFEGPAMNDGRDHWDVLHATPLEDGPPARPLLITTDWTIAWSDQIARVGTPGDTHPMFSTAEKAIEAFA